jgi:hypothetical protein
MVPVLNLAGQLLSFIGLAMALKGLEGMKEEFFPGRALPCARAWYWLLTRVFRRKREGRAAALSGTLAGTAALSAAFGESLPARPETETPSAAWTRYILQRIENLETLRAREHRETLAQLSAVEKRVAGQTGALAQRIGELDARMRRALAGEDGRGLDFTWWGLAVTASGILLQVAGAGIDLWRWATQTS